MESKTCTKCKQNKNISEFSFRKNGFDKLCSWCKKCKSYYAQSFNKKFPEKYKIHQANYKERRTIEGPRIIINSKICTNCKTEKNISEFAIQRLASDGRRGYCLSCEKIISKKWRVTAWAERLIAQTRQRANNKKWDFDLDKEFLKELWENQNGLCYWLSIPLLNQSSGRDLQKPSIDRLDDSKGYIKSNVVLSCQFANIGRSSIPADEFKKFIDTFLKLEISQ